MAKKFTFKKEPRETGLAAIGSGEPSTIIKLEKKEVGLIASPNWRTQEKFWRIRLMVNREMKDNCDWEWITLKAKFEEEPKARAFLNEKFDLIIALDLRKADDD